MSKYILGLDMGITSVGWGLIDGETGEIVDKGVRLFKEGTAEDNLKRRLHRSSRRLKRRRYQRILELKRLLKKEGILEEGYTPLYNVYELRCKGLKQKLTNQELVTVLINIAKRRGSSFDIVEDDETKAKDNEICKNTLKSNEYELKTNNLKVCEKQYQILQSSGEIRGIGNLYRSSSYKEELNSILAQQQLSKEIMDKIISIIFRQRDFNDGPGSEQSPTIYGRFIPNENGEITILSSMIDKMRGKCSIFEDEYRAPKMSFTSDLFNFLNDLNNLTVDGNEITENEKKEIVDKYILPKGKISVKELCKFFGVEEEKIEGFRRNGDKSIITEFKGYQKVLNSLKETSCSKIFTMENIFIVDEIIEVLTKYKDINRRIEELNRINKLDYQELATPEIINKLANISGVAEYHSLSYKAMKVMMPYLWETSDNQMQILSKLNLMNQSKTNFEGRKHIPSLGDEIYSPVAKRVHNETVKVINAIIKQYGELDSIVIEMARDRNSAEEKKHIEQMNENGRKLNEEAARIIGANSEKIIRSTPKLVAKIRLYEEQDGKCAYSGKQIDLKRLIEDPTAYEIDHIIPISISLDDSLNNKVLVLSEENRAKSNRTPFQYFTSGQAKGWSFNAFQQYVLELYSNKRISRRKLQNLLTKEDITKIEVRKKFIERNLVDTRYASRLILNLLKDYFKVNGKSTKVFTVRGQITSLFRKSRKLKKSREMFYHHIVDALIVAYTRKFNYINELMQYGFNYVEKLDEETGELVRETVDLFSSKDDSFTQKIRELNELTVYDDKINISHKVDRKPNRQFTDETIYVSKKIDGEYIKIAKYKDIYGPDGIKLAKKLNDEKEWDNFLMKKVDPETFELLVRIVKNTTCEKNESPFLTYCHENNIDFIRKKSKKGNGPIIKSIRYYEKGLGNYVDISHKYNNLPEDKKIVLLQVSPFRTDFYKDENGLYKFLTVRYADLKMMNKGYCIPNEKYQSLKEMKKINESDKFIFSLYTNDYLQITKQDGSNILTEKYRFVGTNSDRTNIIELKPIHCNQVKEKPRIKISIGKNIIDLKKIEVDVLGRKMLKCKDKCLQLEF